MSDKDSHTHEKSAAANYAIARAFAVAINALIAGLIATAFFAVALLWLQRSSGIRLEKSQYGGVLVFILLLTTLCAYLVFDYFQSKKEEAFRRKRAMAKVAEKRPDKMTSDDWGAILETRLKEYDPLFKENEEKPAPQPEPVKHAAVLGNAALAEPVPTPAPAVAAAVAAPVPVAAPAAVRDPTAILFAQGVMAAIAAMEEAPSLFLHFGIDLFMAGAASELAARGRLSPAQGKLVLESMLFELGLSKRTAGSFASNAGTFAQVPHFRAPIEAGFRAMAQFVQTGMMDALAADEMLCSGVFRKESARRRR